MFKVTKKYDVHFMLNDYSYRVKSRALELVEKSNLSRRMMGDNVTTDTDDNTFDEENFIDKMIVKNKEQRSAVKAIVEKKSGMDPVSKSVSNLG